MDIAQAKQELRRTIRAYTAKTEDGVYRMPRRMQRPVLLMGPPGIGKTAILSQLAQEEHIGLAAYTMTHHTRQSALGLPVIVGRTAAGKTFRATEYTMSEIIASVYEQMEKTGLHEGILFLDEINCVSETLMPAILQMLQNKTFGVHSLPEGWLIVAAGNPPRYNQSARSFDMATLDRVRCIELEPSLAAWQPYAAASGVHPAVLSYLRLHPEHFFLCSASAAAGEFATARGWEELSALLLAYEALGYPCTLAQMQQYLHAQEAAAGFAAFYELFRRYAAQLPLEEILTGGACPEAGALRELPFDGRLSVVEFLLHSLQTKSAAMQQDADLAFSASSFAGSVPPGADALARAQELLQKRRAALAVRKDCGVLPPEEEQREAAFLSRAEAAFAPARTDAEASAALQKLAADAAASAQTSREAACRACENGLRFVQNTFGEDQELWILLHGLQSAVEINLVERSLNLRSEKNVLAQNVELISHDGFELFVDVAEVFAGGKADVLSLEHVVEGRTDIEDLTAVASGFFEQDQISVPGNLLAQVLKVNGRFDLREFLGFQFGVDAVPGFGHVGQNLGDLHAGEARRRVHGESERGDGDLLEFVAVAAFQFLEFHDGEVFPSHLVAVFRIKLALLDVAGIDGEERTEFREGNLLVHFV